MTHPQTLSNGNEPWLMVFAGGNSVFALTLGLAIGTRLDENSGAFLRRCYCPYILYSFIIRYTFFGICIYHIDIVCGDYSVISMVY